jgi:hypothetical protein
MYCNEALFMQEYDLYINPQKPTVGLYVRTGAGLHDLADATLRQFISPSWITGKNHKQGGHWATTRLQSKTV